jgi:hypothetical protein
MVTAHGWGVTVQQKQLVAVSEDKNYISVSFHFSVKPE